MESITVERMINKDQDEVHTKMDDLERFMSEAGFDRVKVEGDTLEVANQVGPKKIELILELVDREGSELAYRQLEGIFREMETRYSTEGTPDGTRVTATTDFELDFNIVGSFLDSTVIKIQRKRELNAQFDYLED